MEQTFETLKSIEKLIQDPVGAVAVLEDTTSLTSLVLLMNNTDTEIVKTSLKIFHTLSQKIDCSKALKSVYGLTETLNHLLNQHVSSEVKRLSEEILCRLNKDEELKESKTIQLIEKEKRVKACRRRSFFVGVSKPKTIVLQIRGMRDKYDEDLCRDRLITVKGVISITFDLERKRSTLRVRADLKPELLAAAITQTMTMAADQVVKDEFGNEHIKPLVVQSEITESTEEMPDYPLEDHSPIKDEGNNVARTDGNRDEGGKWRFVKTVGAFISNSFYW